MCTSPDPTFTVCSDVTETSPAPASVDPRDFRKHFMAAVGACVFLTVVAVMMCVMLVCHHARSRHYMKHVIKSMRHDDNNNVIPTHVTSTRQSFINFRGELDSGISLGDNGHSFVWHTMHSLDIALSDAMPLLICYCILYTCICIWTMRVRVIDSPQIYNKWCLPLLASIIYVEPFIVCINK